MCPSASQVDSSLTWGGDTRTISSGYFPKEIIQKQADIEHHKHITFSPLRL